MLKIERPVLNVGRLEVGIDARNVLKRVADSCWAAQRIVKRGGVDGYYLLEWRIARNQIRLVEAEGHLIVVQAVSDADGSGAFAERIPSDADPRSIVIGRGRDRLAER